MKDSRTGIYARVSTIGKGQDAETQLVDIRDFVRARQLEGLGAVEYIDEISAVKVKPQLEKLMKDAQAGRVNTVVVWKIDRIARSVKDFVMILSQLDSWNVRFIATSQGIDTDRNNPVSRLIMHVIAAMAEFERSLISERVKLGIERRRKKGLPLGRNRVMVSIAMVHNMQDEGKTIPQIAEILKVSEATIMRRLRVYKLKEAA